MWRGDREGFPVAARSRFSPNYPRSNGTWSGPAEAERALPERETGIRYGQVSTLSLVSEVEFGLNSGKSKQD
jgi:hypothetical protein